VAEPRIYDSDEIELLLRAGRLALETESSTDGAERIVAYLARAFDTGPVQVAATPTSLTIALGPIGDQQVQVIRAKPGSLNLGGSSGLDEVVRKSLSGKLTAGEALDEVIALEQPQSARRRLLSVPAWGVAAAAITVLIGGRGFDAVLALLTGCVVGGVMWWVGRNARAARVLAPVVAFLGAFAAVAFAHMLFAAFGWETAPVRAIVASLLLLIPAFSLVVAVEELALGHLLAGSSRMFGAVLVIFGVVLGATLGRQVGRSLLGPLSEGEVLPLPVWAFVIAAAVAGAAFSVGLGLRGVAVVVVALAVMLMATLARGMQLAFQDRISDVAAPLLATFVSAFILGLVGALVARYTTISALVIIVPSSFMLIPGALGFGAFQSLFAQQTQDGVATLITALATIAALVYGLLVATAIAPRPFAQYLTAKPASRD
jgi:uncharacterized membrane protein YjjP (DUF1212 family)